MKLEAGMDAPDFSAGGADGHRWTLSGLRGQKVILYFYPVDDTRRCTAQACDFRDSQAEWKEAGYVVLGVSAQGADSHRAFAQKYSLNFPLLIDEDLTFADASGRNRPATRQHPPLSNRSTFVIDEDGRLVEAQYGVKWDGHIDELRKKLWFSPSDSDSCFANPRTRWPGRRGRAKAATPLTSDRPSPRCPHRRGPVSHTSTPG